MPAPLPVTPDLIREAAARIRGFVRETPVLRPGLGCFGLDLELTLKLEHLQHGGSFKARGAFNTLLSQPVPAVGVIAASGGNHGIAVALAAQRLGAQAEIFVPAAAPAAKVERLRGLGATVHLHGANYAEALAASQQRAAETGALTVHAYDQESVLAGQGTLAQEWEQQSQLDTVLVAVGGGGLIGGMAAWYAGRVKVVAVEPFTAPTLFAARQAGQPVDVAVGGVAADSLGSRRIGELAFPVTQQHVAAVVQVDDEAILSARRALWQQCRLLVETGGATALAALLSGQYQPQPGERVGVLLCGANTDPATLM
ncbi:threonine/serine dehydratase [Leeia sp.]|uniref:threonine/serine dehydratase n=1 Tax=Leeia sp. TaxID=2884678 RepID=UPI0035B470E3